MIDKKKQTERYLRYKEKSREDITFSLPKGKKALYKEYAAAHNTSVSALFQEYMDKLINEETPD